MISTEKVNELRKVLIRMAWGYKHILEDISDEQLWERAYAEYIGMPLEGGVVFNHLNVMVEAAAGEIVGLLEDKK